MVSMTRPRPAMAPSVAASQPTRTIDQCPLYCALSYVWGTDEPSNGIEINGKLFLVRDNLWAALYELANSDTAAAGGKGSRKTDTSLRVNGSYFWIDAPCIDQEDVHERGHQVNMMHDIFSAGETVIAWLGNKAQNSNLAMDVLSPTSSDLKVNNQQSNHEPEEYRLTVVMDAFPKSAPIFVRVD
ncbi:heterokaryon incompatibility protein-domain-containing protein [Truncatella angustata]|uniref:Heterokaryon incompatibility protein-domain-containing protein n=1 Tax=Truncatella angustata TaxID=152316 RepID=A0A9P8RJ79_9PEZI|nr:heterokaryon incompatibility protein-domain-containing protein [Truncatella angustata]KAH6646844.1 heterokaryon incompatibility protein-domain-containing protein [Truncatella angustata]